jgi:hypothetical protein
MKLLLKMIQKDLIMSKLPPIGIGRDFTEKLFEFINEYSLFL